MLLDKADHVRLALSPIRRRLLERLRQPASATELAGELALGRQRINYHLRALEVAGLIISSKNASAAAASSASWPRARRASSSIRQ